MKSPISFLLATIALASVSSTSDAAIYIGNPRLGLRVDRPQGDYVEGVVHLDGVWVHACGGGSTWYAIGEDVDPVAGHSLTITGGDLCGVTWDWGSPMTIDGSGSSGAYTVEASDTSTWVSVDPDIEPAALASWEVLSGTMSGGGPWVLTYLE